MCLSDRELEVCRQGDSCCEEVDVRCAPPFLPTILRGHRPLMRVSGFGQSLSRFQGRPGHFLALRELAPRNGQLVAAKLDLAPREVDPDQQSKPSNGLDAGSANVGLSLDSISAATKRAWGAGAPGPCPP